MRYCLLPILLIIAGCSVPERNFPIEPPKSLSHTVEGNTLELRIPAGEVVIRGVTDEELSSTLQFYCASPTDSCARKATEAKFITTLVDGQTIVSVEPERAFSYRKTTPKFEFRVPPVEMLRVVMGPGDVTIQDIAGCLEVDMDAGDIDVSLPLETVGKVHLDANFGDASMQLPEGHFEGKRRLLVGAEVDWDQGSGSCDLDVRLQAGDVSVELTN